MTLHIAAVLGALICASAVFISRNTEAALLSLAMCNMFIAFEMLLMRSYYGAFALAVLAGAVVPALLFAMLRTVKVPGEEMGK